MTKYLKAVIKTKIRVHASTVLVWMARRTRELASPAQWSCFSAARSGWPHKSNTENDLRVIWVGS